MEFTHSIVDANTPHNPHIKAAGDIDGDGLADLVVASSNGGPLVWYQNPSWERREVAPEGKWSCDALVVDMNGDGRADILTSEWYGENRMEWFENPGSSGGSWKRHIIGPPRAHDIEVADLDGDGQAELVTRTQGQDGDHFVVRKRKADGTWSAIEVACPAGEGLAVGDVNEDGRLEIVIADRYYTNASGAFDGPWEEVVFADWPDDAVVKLADIDADGRLDIVVTRSEGKHRVSWFEPPQGSAGGLWTEHIVDDSVDFAHSLEVCDIDNDGRLDIVTAEMHQSDRKRVLVYRNLGKDRWERTVVADTGSHKLRVAQVGPERAWGLLGANWSGDFQPLELWLVEP
jgi:hypothetical protein